MLRSVDERLLIINWSATVDVDTNFSNTTARQIIGER